MIFLSRIVGYTIQVSIISIIYYMMCAWSLLKASVACSVFLACNTRPSLNQQHWFIGSVGTIHLYGGGVGLLIETSARG